MYNKGYAVNFLNIFFRTLYLALRSSRTLTAAVTSSLEALAPFSSLTWKWNMKYLRLPNWERCPKVFRSKKNLNWTVFLERYVEFWRMYTYILHYVKRRYVKFPLNVLLLKYNHDRISTLYQLITAYLFLWICQLLSDVRLR